MSNAMPTTSRLDLWTICFTPQTYDEDFAGKEMEPRKRYLEFVLHSLDRKWHVKFIFQGNLQSAQDITFAKVSKRQKDLENLCLCIDFDSTPLFDDTVTELLLTLTHDPDIHQQTLCLKTRLDAGNEYAVVNSLWLRAREESISSSISGIQE